MSSTEGTQEQTGTLKFFESYDDFVKQVKESSVEYFPTISDEQIKTIYDSLLKLQGEGVDFTIMEMSSAIQNMLWQLQNNHALSLLENLMPNYNTPLNRNGAQEAGKPAPGSTHTKDEIKTVLKKHKHSFKWPLPLEVESDEYMLIMGVAATEGEFKSGDVFTGDNLEYAAGAMSTAAMFGASTINTDHYHEELPAEYKELYGLDGVGTHGAIIDAAVETNKVVDKDGKTHDLKQVEWIGYTTNKQVYSLIKEGKYIGCSVEDYSRKQHCDCGKTKCNCTIEGSHFLDLGLILKEVPDSHGTWVRAVTAEDLAAWKSAAEKSQHAVSPKIATKMTWHLANLKMYSKIKKHSLDDYIDRETGAFHEGKQGILEYLMEDVEIPEADAKDIAAYLAENPKALNVTQMEYMSAADFVAWFRHKQNEALDFMMHKLHLQLLKQDEAGYATGATEKQCKTCRWYNEGKCNLVEGDIAEDSTCNRYEAMPGQESNGTQEGTEASHTDHSKGAESAPLEKKVRKLPTALIEPNPTDAAAIAKHTMKESEMQELIHKLESANPIGTHRINVHEYDTVRKIAIEALRYAIELSKKN